MNSLFSQVCLQPSFIYAPLLSPRALLPVFLISFSSPTLLVLLLSPSVLLPHTLSSILLHLFFIIFFFNPFLFVFRCFSYVVTCALSRAMSPPIINDCLLPMSLHVCLYVCFVHACTMCPYLMLLVYVQPLFLSFPPFSLSFRSHICLFTSSSSFFSTLSPFGPDSPLKCFAKAGKMEPNQLFNGFGPLQPAVAVH